MHMVQNIATNGSLFLKIKWVMPEKKPTERILYRIN